MENETNEYNYSSKELFALRCSPVYWLITAEEIKESCNTLINDYIEDKYLVLTIYSEPLKNNEPIHKNMLSKGFYLLAGFTLENLIKGILICQNANLINTGKLEKDIKSHDLFSLYLKVKESILDKKEESLLKILSEAIPYWGRYPAPLIAEKLKLEHLIDKEVIKDFESIYQKLHIYLCKSLKKGWKSGLDNGIGDIKDFKWNTFESG